MTIELMLEAERRGILPEDKKIFLDEARKRGLVPAENLTAHTQKGETKDGPQSSNGGMHLEHADKGIGNELIRQLGLTGRYLTEGVLSPATAVGDALNSGINGLFGTDLMPASRAVSETLTNIGVPNPQNPTERVVGDVSRAVAGAGSLAKVGNAIKDIGPYSKALGELFTNKLGLQSTSAASAAGGAGIAREAGAGPVGQLTAGLVAGVGAPAALSSAYTGAKSLYNAGKELFRSTDDIVGETLRNLSSNSDDALNGIRNSKEIIPNSPFTTGEASGDPGLIAAQRALRNKSPQDFYDIASRQNTARNQFLDDFVGSEQDIKNSMSARDRVTSSMREAAFGNKKPVSISPIQKSIVDLRSLPSSERSSVDTATNWVLGRLKGLGGLTDSETSSAGTYVDDFGSPVSSESIKKETIADPERLYALRQDINDAMQGKYDQGTPGLSLAKSYLKNIKDSIDAVIEEGSPGFKEYVYKYAEMSKPINQMESLQDIRTKITNTSPDLTGYNFLSQPKLNNILAKEDLGKLSNEQQFKLAQLLKDMDRSQALNNPAIRPLGSDTIANAAGKDVLTSLLTDKLKSIPLGKYIVPSREQALNSRLSEAFTKPDLAALLMQKVKPEKSSNYIEELRKALLAETIGGSTALALQPR